MSSQFSAMHTRRQFSPAPSAIAFWCGMALFGLTGCQTPELQPFSAVSTEVAAGINQGGDMVVSALGRDSLTINGELVAPGVEAHPAKQLATEWALRKKASDALLVYSASLAAISEASANRKANATALYDSVQKLAGAIPGVSLGSSAVGNLVINVAGTFVEVKAWKAMDQAVRGADPAIQLLADVFRQDLLALEQAHSARYTGAIIEAEGGAIRKLRQLHGKLRAEQITRRDAVAGNPTDSAAAAELARIDELLGPVERELAMHRAEIARLQTHLDDGRDFYAKASAAVEAWAAAHADLVRAFEQKRSPNLALLIARAQELKASVAALKTSPLPVVSP